MKKTIFSSKDLIRGSNIYHGSGIWSGNMVYKNNVLDTLHLKPRDRLENIFNFLSNWQAFRGRSGVRNLMETEIPDWLSKHGGMIDCLQKRPLHALNPQEFHNVLILTTSLWELDIPPTAYGKFLHALIPDSVILWDGKVRKRLELGIGPCSYFAYQVFGHRLLRYLLFNEGTDVFDKILDQVETHIGYREPLTKILDEMAYERPTYAKRAVKALGGYEEAFEISSILKKAR